MTCPSFAAGTWPCPAADWHIIQKRTRIKISNSLPGGSGFLNIRPKRPKGPVKHSLPPEAESGLQEDARRTIFRQ